MTNINKTSLEDSLRKKGAIKADKVIEHEALLKDRELFNSLSNLEHDLLRYLRTKAEIVEAYQRSNSWEDVITSVVYNDDPDSNEAFVEYVEEVYSIEIKTAIELDKAIGSPVEWTGEVFIKAMDNKYSTALEYAINNGAKYKELLLIEPKDFNLPEAWKTWRDRDKNKAILWALNMSFMLSEPGGLMLLPDFRNIAKEMEAPYSVIMEAKNITNSEKRDTTKTEISKISDRVEAKIEKLIEATGDKYLKDYGVDKENTEVYKMMLSDMIIEFTQGISQTAIKDITKKESKCNKGIEEDIRIYFSEELEDFKTFIYGTNRN